MIETIDDVIKAVIQNPEWLEKEYDIVQHTFINPCTNEKIATIFLYYNEFDNIEQINVQPTLKSLPIFTLFIDDGMFKAEDENFIYCISPMYRIFYFLINEYFKECLKGW